MSEPSVSRHVFIGRAKELSAFRSLLSGPSDGAWILVVYGSGGMGKTWLLEQLRHIVLNEYPHVLITKQFVDFYFTSNQHEFGVLRNVASQLGTENFAAFEKALSHYEERMEKLIPLSPDEQQGLQSDVYDHFVEDYKALASRQRIVLLFDTAEEAGEAGVNLWRSVLPQLRGNTIVVIAGRHRLPLGDVGEAIYLSIDELEPDEVIEYFRRRGFETESLSNETIERIWRRTSGRPILIALAADFLESHPVEELVALSKDEFLPSFVSRVCDLGQFENQAILFMAHAWRRFNSEILAYLSGRSPEACAQTIQRLRWHSFIKYRPPQMSMAESCMLHDEMRVLVKKHIWPSTDRDEMLRRELSGRMVDYYEQQIPAALDWRQQQSLTSEQLYYHLDYNLDEGFGASRRLFEEKSKAYDVGFCEALNTEVERYREHLPEPYRYQHDFHRAWVALRRERHADAITLWETLTADADVDNSLKARALIHLVEAYADNSEFVRSLERGEQAKDLYEAMKEAPLAPEERSKVDQEMSLLYNNLGYVCRKQDKWADAINYYEQALEAGGPPWQQARIRNNLGFAHHLLGHSELAFSHCETALRIRKKLGIPYELGLSYNTLGILCVDALRIPEAEANFHRARLAFDRAHSRRGQSLVNTALGRLYRQWGWYEEHVVGMPFDRDRERYRKALEYLQEATAVYERVDDEAGLAESLAELGCTYRERREWERAVDHLSRALALAGSRGIRRREADILQDLSLTYWRQDILEEARRYAMLASEKAEAAEFYYLLSKAQWTLGDIAFDRGEFEEAFQEYAKACINITKLDPEAMGHQSAKKTLHYQDLVKHVEEQILRIPDLAHVKSAWWVLVEEWETAGLGDEFRGFIERIKAVSTGYDLLSTCFHRCAPGLTLNDS